MMKFFLRLDKTNTINLAQLACWEFFSEQSRRGESVDLARLYFIAGGKELLRDPARTGFYNWVAERVPGAMLRPADDRFLKTSHGFGFHKYSLQSWQADEQKVVLHFAGHLYPLTGADRAAFLVWATRVAKEAPMAHQPTLFA